jgi:hypothetical protein
MQSSRAGFSLMTILGVLCLLGGPALEFLNLVTVGDDGRDAKTIPEIRALALMTVVAGVGFLVGAVAMKLGPAPAPRPSAPFVPPQQQGYGQPQ